MKNPLKIKKLIYALCFLLGTAQPVTAANTFSSWTKPVKKWWSGVREIETAYSPNILSKWQHPKYSWTITFREPEISTLKTYLRVPEVKVVALFGKPKVGKTAVVVGAAEDLANKLNIQTLNIEALITANQGVGKPTTRLVSDVVADINRILNTVTKNGQALHIEDIETLIPTYTKDAGHSPLYDPFDGDLGALRKAAREKLKIHFEMYPAKTIVEFNNEDSLNLFINIWRIKPGSLRRLDITEPTIETTTHMLTENISTIRASAARRLNMPIDVIDFTDESVATFVKAAARFRSDQGLPGSAISLMEEVATHFLTKNADRYQSVQFVKTQLDTLTKELEEFRALENELTINGKKYVGQFAYKKVKDLEDLNPNLKKQLEALQAKQKILKDIYGDLGELYGSVKLRRNELDQLLDTNASPEIIAAKQSEIRNLLMRISDNHTLINSATGRHGGLKIGSYDVAEFFAQEKMGSSTPEKILLTLRNELDIPDNIFQKLSAKVIKQFEFIRTSIKDLIRVKMGIRDVNRPFFSYLIFGSSGVGKTNMAEQLSVMMNNEATDQEIIEFLKTEGMNLLTQSNRLFGKIRKSEPSIIRIRGTEFQEKHSVSKITGSPPGYIAYNEKTLMNHLEDCVNSGKFCVLLFDEYEKADQAVQKLLMEFMDKGEITLANGKTIKGNNVGVIATSNAVRTDDIKKFVDQNKLPPGILNDPKALGDFAKQFVITEKGMLPEVIGRFDAVIYAMDHTVESLMETAKAMFKPEFEKQLYNLRVGFDISDEALRKLATDNLDPKLGVRTMRNQFSEIIETMCVDAILTGRLNRGETLRVMLGANNQYRLVRVLVEKNSSPIKYRFSPLLKEGEGNVFRLAQEIK